MLGMNRLKELTRGLDDVIKSIRTEGKVRENFLKIVQLSQSAFVKQLVASLNVDIKILDVILNALQNDQQVSDIVGAVANIFDCFSVDRFIGVETEKEMEDMAVKLNEKKLFLAGIYFDNVDSSTTDLRYKLRMDIDNTPVTLENRNRFWFPGPDGNFELQMRYHRGFIQTQHMIDRAIIKSLVQEENKRLKQIYEAEKAAKEEEEARNAAATITPTEEPGMSSSEKELEEMYGSEEDEHINLNETVNVENKNITNSAIQASSTEKVTSDFNSSTEPFETTSIHSTDIDSISENVSSSILDHLNQSNSSHSNLSDEKLTIPDEVLEDVLNFHDEEKPTEFFDEAQINEESPPLERKKRSPQLDLFSMFLGGGSSSTNQPKDDDFPGALKMPDFQVYTKQFPYPEYRKDNFKTGLYLAQSVQLAFFFALIVQVSVAVRNRIWMRESGNSTVSLIFISC